MKNILVAQLIFVCFSAQIVANQISFFNNGGEKGIARYYASNLKGRLTSSGENMMIYNLPLHIQNIP